MFRSKTSNIFRFLDFIWAVPSGSAQGPVFAVYATLGVLCVFAGIKYQMWWLLGLPAGLAIVWLAFLDFRKIFFLMLACIPISMEESLPGGFATDFPSEQLMWLLTATGVAWFVLNWRSIDVRFIKHPLTLALLAHLSWMTVCAVTSQDPYVSFKYLLAKGWYVIVFYFLAAHILTSEKEFRKMVMWMFVPLLAAVCVVVVRHAAIGFSYTRVEYVMGPFFRNHVMYACSIAIFMPFVWYATYWYRRFSATWWLLVAGILIFLVAINFSYTRAAYVALLAAVGIYWMLRLRLMKVALAGMVLVISALIFFVSRKDNWLEFAPNYEKTITHVRFESLLQATTKLEDISTMERVYRWVAASYMLREHPVVGFGPSTFYFYYKNYTVSSFKTYVSRNPEHSGMHNYFLLMAVEEGIPGFLFFLVLSFMTMLKGEKIFHQTKDPSRRRTLAAAVMCFVLIDLLMLMNDFVETDKIGSLFFMCIAIIVNIDLTNRSEAEAGDHPVSHSEI
jgi:O-antigen ligase